MHHLSKVKLRGDVSGETLDYFFVKNPRLGRFYLLPKIHKRLHCVPGRPVISNCGYYTENISAFIDHHLQPLSSKVKSYIKDTNDFIKKLRDLPPLLIRTPTGPKNVRIIAWILKVKNMKVSFELSDVGLTDVDYTPLDEVNILALLSRELKLAYTYRKKIIWTTAKDGVVPDTTSNVQPI